MTAERWQLRLEFNVIDDGIDYRPRLEAMVSVMRETLGADFIDHTSIEFVCERVDPPEPVEPGACPYCGGHVSDPATHPCVGAASPSSAGASRETAP